MLTTKTHGAWFLFLLAIVILSLSWFFVSLQGQEAKHGKIVSLTLGETEPCFTDVGGCPFHSIQAFTNGSYLVQDSDCTEDLQCKGRLTEQETSELQLVLKKVGFFSLANALAQCSENAGNFASPFSKRTWIRLETEDTQTFVGNDSTSCENPEDAARFRQLVSKLKTILKPENRRQMRSE
jgi:hypothetical protein